MVNDMFAYSPRYGSWIRRDAKYMVMNSARKDKVRAVAPIITPGIWISKPIIKVTISKIRLAAMEIVIAKGWLLAVIKLIPQNI